jgi:CheY-like chemotaxis protein
MLMEIALVKIIKCSILDLMDKVVLIEDDKLIREIYSFTLQKAGYDVVSAEDGEEGIDLVRSNPGIKLILLDVIMPKMDGVEALKQLKSDPLTKDIPVILLSNLTDQETVDAALKYGAYGFLVKAQMSQVELVDKVREMVEFYNNKQKKA